MIRRPRSALPFGLVLTVLVLAGPALAGCTSDGAPADSARSGGPGPAVPSAGPPDGPGPSGPSPGATARPSLPAASGKDGLLARLRGGGTVIIFRHATTDRSQQDLDERGSGTGEVVLEDCSTQRNLSDAGRAESAVIGAAFRELAIPVGELWVSPYCRSRDTAKLAFRQDGQVVDGLERLYPNPDREAQNRLNAMIRRSAPEAGTPNLVIVAHGVYPSVLAPAVPLGEGEAAVYDLADGRSRLLGRLQPDEWADLG